MQANIYDDDAQLAYLAISIDKQIYDLVKVTVHNFQLNHFEISVQDIAKAYERCGQHQIDFNKIYDLGE